ncbi:MAG: protein kinase [Polyangiaceae bacterium]|nr:protein kinase [Polyangiaceae bacterium]
MGRYRLGERVEDAAASETFRATDPVLGRSVWLKRIKAHVEHATAAAAELDAEARRLGRLSHPALTQLVEHLPDEHAIAYAEPGAARLHELSEQLGPLDPVVVMALAVEVARALSALHAAGLVHGWLRAEHVELGATGTVRVHGWGASPFAAATRPPMEQSLDPPENLAPEQVLGDATDERSDVFLLGSLAFTAVTGQRPFGGAGGVVHRLRHEPAPPVRRLAPSAPVELEELLARCLDRRPAHRPDLTTTECALVAVLRRHSALPTDLLVRRALGRGGFVPMPALPRGLTEHAPRPRPRASTVATGALVLAAAIAIGVAVGVGATSRPAEDAAPTGTTQPARLRVLATPWAEVEIDGRHVDTTPIGWPIEVAPGRHVVRFRHPAAPDETRVVELGAGQTQLLDVTMSVRLPSADAAARPVAPEEEVP